MFKLILMALPLLLWGFGVGTERSASVGYDQVFEAAGPGWDPDSSPAPQGDDTSPTTDGGPGWDPDGLK